MAKITVILILLAVSIKAQQPVPTPVATGKSYSSLELERPATTAPRFPPTVTF